MERGGVTVSPDDPGARALTGLRGAAALLVMLHHFILHQPIALHWAVAGFLERGYLAVDLFFVLSGFVMARAYGGWFKLDAGWRTGMGAFLEFVLRRVARLWPLHAAVVLAVLAQQAWSGSWTAWPRQIVSNLLMVQAWGLSQSVNVPSWSVSTEMAAYLLFPVLAAVALHGSRGAAWAALLGAAGLLVLSAMVMPLALDGRHGALDVHRNWSVLPVMRCLGGFTIGVLTCRMLRWPVAQSWLGRPACSALAAAALLACLVAGVPDLLLYILLPVLVASLQTGHGPLQALLLRPSMQHLGVLSYALYLVHYPILEALPQAYAPVAVQLLVFLLVSGIVAALAHWTIERPGRRAIRNAGWAVHARVAEALAR